MKFPIFASFIVFIAWLTYELSKSRQKNEQAEKSFWEKETQANSVRKKSLDHLNYVRFDFHTLPSKESFLNANLPIPESLFALLSLQEKQMVNLSGYSNTDLKLAYGTANLTILSEYDENFELFCKNIYLLAQALDEACRTEEALSLLEDTLVWGTDISGHYKLLARIYQRKNELSKIQNLKEKAMTLKSITKPTILSALDEIILEMSS